MENLKIEIYDNKKLIYTSENANEVIQNLLYYCYAKAVNKSKAYTIKNKLSYDNKQKIRIIEKTELNTREIVLYNIPTKMACLDTYKLMEALQ